ncbi:hypothetical protein SMU57_05316 [Streptococcus mutans NMT4863]|nr:hypothetical protein SMU57_05316 [Streptococcus mutans NMT4863]EMC27271.1 hypothetical protein SMU85_07654 [Streptococcus mutans ST6]
MDKNGVGVDTRLSENEKKIMPRKVFDKTSKIAVVKLILEEEQLVKMISSALGVYPNSLYQVQEYNNMKKKRTNISKRS